MGLKQRRDALEAAAKVVIEQNAGSEQLRKALAVSSRGWWGYVCCGVEETLVGLAALCWFRYSCRLACFPTSALLIPRARPSRIPQDWIPVKDNGAIAGAAAKEVTAALEAMGSDGHLATTDTASAQGALTFIRVGAGCVVKGMELIDGD